MCVNFMYAKKRLGLQPMEYFFYIYREDYGENQTGSRTLKIHYYGKI